MTSPESTNVPVEVITRKKFIGSAGGLATGAVLGAAAYLSSEEKANATDMNFAYLDQSTPFTAAQTFTGKVLFKSGSPWVDVQAFGATGSGGTMHPTDDTTAIQNAINAAISAASGTGNVGNPIIYFPPGIYLISGTGLNPAINSSNFTLLGAGYQSSILKWNTPNSPLANILTLVNPRNVVIRDLGFNGLPQTSGVVAAINITRNSGLVSSSIPPTGVIVERVCIGDPTQPAGTTIFGYGIVYIAASGQDTYGDNGTFRDVSIFNSINGYYFSTAGGLRHVIEGGSVQNCTGIAISSIPNPFTGSTGGGSYTVIGTRFGGNAITFQIGQCTSGEAISINGMIAGSFVNPETQLISTPAALTDQSVVFTGGQAVLTGTGTHVNFNASQGLLEFHGVTFSATSGVNYNFPGTGQVNFYGGQMNTKTCTYNGPLQIHGAQDASTAVFTPTSGTSTTARLLQFGHANQLGGSTAYIPPANVITPSGATATVTGSDLGGTIQLVVGSGGLPVGQILHVNFLRSFLSPPLLILSPGSISTTSSPAAAAMKSVYSSGNTTTAFYLNTSVALVAGTYNWSYLLLG